LAPYTLAYAFICISAAPSDAKNGDSKVKKRDRRELQEYVRGIADRLELKDWKFQLATANLKNQCAKHHYVYGRKVARIVFHKTIRKEDPEELRQTLCHELIHTHLVGVWDMIIRDIGGSLESETYDIMIEGFRRQMEYAVDALADAIAPHMPLIEWPS
jgi:hypothetical protein